MEHTTTVIKTGARVFLEEYGELVLTDLKKTGNVYHFWIESSAHVQFAADMADADYTVERLADRRQFNREAMALETEVSTVVDRRTS